MLLGRGTRSMLDRLSERAVALADANVRLNFGEEAPHTSLAVDAVEYLRTSATGTT